MYIEPSNGARVLRCGVSNTWFGAHTDNALHINAEDGVVTGLQFTNCMFLANAGHGVFITGSGVDGLYFDNSFSGGNLGNGLTVTGDAKDVVWSGGVLGACHEMAGNVGYGYNVAEGCDVELIFPDLEGNSQGQGVGYPVLYAREDLIQKGEN